MLKERKIFEEFLKERNLKQSIQRMEILRVFIETEKHLTTDELYRIVKKKYPSIGYATVYRTLKLLCECGCGRELKFEDGITRYEHKYRHEHHDHLVCIKCGKFVEVIDPKIEELQKRMAKKYGFAPERHRMEIYGICKGCKRKHKKG